MKAVVLEGPGQAAVKQMAAKPVAGDGEILLQVRRVGLCGSDLNSYRGRNPLVTFPRIPGHEVAATVAEANPNHLGVAGGDGGDAIALYELRRLCFLPARTAECLPIQSDAGRAARRRVDGIHRYSCVAVIPGGPDLERALPGGTADRWLSCGGAGARCRG